MRAEYISRINRVIDFIDLNIESELSLEKLARVADFSPFHFHRIFAAMTGETLTQFIQRLRVEKAASYLVHNPKKSVTEIALDCGFSGSSTFARAFKGMFGMSASEWRYGGYKQDRKIGKTDSKDSQQFGKQSQDFDTASCYIESEIFNQKWRIQMKGKSNIKAEVEVKEVPEFCVAYVRHVGPYKGDAALFGRLFGKLAQWAGPRGLLGSPDAKFMAIYHDDPNVTDESKLRTDVCVTVPKDTPVDGEIGKMTIAAGKYAVARFELANDEYEDAWNAVYGGWLPESGYQPADGPCYELYLNNPEEHPEKKCIVEIHVPVKPL